MANKQLTAKVKLDITDAERKLKKLSNLLNSLNKAINKPTGKSGLDTQLHKAKLQQEKLTQATLKTKLAQQKVTEQTRKTELATHKLKTATDKATTSTSKLLSFVKKLAAAYLGVQAIGLGIETADKITGAENRLNNLEDATPQTTAESMDKIYAAAQRARTSYTGMLSDVSKTMTLAGDSFQGNIDNAIRFQEIMAKAYVVGGASQTEASTSMYQLVQALGSGTLAGDELRSVREGAPLAYKAIEEFAQGVLDTDMSLKDLASRGVITSDIVVAAIMDMENGANNINDAFENTAVTFAQAWTKIKNMSSRAFQPALQKLTQMLKSDAVEKIIDVTGRILLAVANLIGWIFDLFGSFFNWCADNWSWLKYIIIGALVAIAAYIGYLAAVTVAKAIVQIGAWLAVHWQMLLILGAIAVVVAGILWLANTTETGAEFICSALMLIATVAIIVGIIIAVATGGIVLLVIGLILAAIALIVTALAYCGEEIMGVIFTVGAAIYNIVVGVVDGILQLVFWLVEPFIGIIEWILNACNGGFNSFGGAVANLIGQVISWFLSLGKVVTKIIDAIFGTDWTSGLSSLQDSVLSWGKSEDAITLSREAPTVSGIAEGLGFDLPSRIEYGAAYDSGAEVGRTIEHKINEFGSSLKTDIGSISDLDNLSNLLPTLPNPNDPSLSLGNTYDPSGANDDIQKALDELNGTTGDINGKLDMTDDDLEYLRKIAEMEWRNEFTTAEIKIDMTNNNTVSGERDLDGIVSYLADTLREEMTNVAYGVHT